MSGGSSNCEKTGCNNVGMRIENLSSLPPELQAKISAQINSASGEKKSKYRSKKVWVDGICFDSQKEADKYLELKVAARCRQIDGFLYHGNVILAEGFDKEHRALTYETDFVVLKPDGTYEIIDTKGYETQVFKNKMKVCKAKYPRLEIKKE